MTGGGGAGNATNATMTGAGNATNATMTGAGNATNATMTGAGNATNATMTGAGNATNATMTGAGNATNATMTVEELTPAQAQGSTRGFVAVVDPLLFVLLTAFLDMHQTCVWISLPKNAQQGFLVILQDQIQIAQICFPRH